jgi:hydroxymethyl cephem carbamoyltransferase
MLILALKTGHDGAVVGVEDGKLLFSIEAEKDSFKRFAHILPGTLLAGAERLGALPEIVALGGWYYQVHGYGVGYGGTGPGEFTRAEFFGRNVKLFSSSHERSHIYGALGMSGDREPGPRTVLVWEGDIGSFYTLDERFNVSREIPVMTQPGGRFGLVYAVAEPGFPATEKGTHRHDYAGKLMALASYGDPYADRNPDVARIVELVLRKRRLPRRPKLQFRDTMLFNAGVESQICKDVGAVVTRRIFEKFAATATEMTPAGSKLLIAGGCGLNCDWNVAWRKLGHFASVFVPPCSNDSGSALGTAVDAMFHETGSPWLDWSVYAGLEFQHDVVPPTTEWSSKPVDLRELAVAVGRGAIVAWVQGKWEIGPRALGNRSLLAEPFRTRTRDRLNEIKEREGYRPIAPCLRLEDAPAAFGDTFHDPYMLYFRRVVDDRLRAVTHVDGSARAQTVTARSNPRLHALLGAFAAEAGIGVLCNTSLNGKGLGFINSMSDLLLYANARGIDHLVVDDSWFERRVPADTHTAVAAESPLVPV